jgi:hypothetical protein
MSKVLDVIELVKYGVKYHEVTYGTPVTPEDKLMIWVNVMNSLTPDVEVFYSNTELLVDSRKLHFFYESGISENQDCESDYE